MVETELARSQQRLQDMHSENTAVLGRLSDRLSAVSDGMNHRLDELEERARRDIAYSLETSLRLKRARLSSLRSPARRHRRLASARRRCEFSAGRRSRDRAWRWNSVWQFGTHAEIIAESSSVQRSHAVRFDTVTGLPETWRTGLRAGEFRAEEEMPMIPAAQLVIGLVRDTLSGFQVCKTTEPDRRVHEHPRSRDLVLLRPRRYWTWLAIALPPMRCCRHR